PYTTLFRSVVSHRAGHPRLRDPDFPVVVDPVVAEEVVVAADNEDSDTNGNARTGTHDALLDAALEIWPGACAVADIGVVVRVVAVDEVVFEQGVVLRQAGVIRKQAVHRRAAGVVVELVVMDPHRVAAGARIAQ